MKLLENISNFNKVEDYLPIVNGAINADIIMMFLIFHGVFKSLYIKQWYKTFNLSACIMDISILILIMIFTRFLYSFVLFCGVLFSLETCMCFHSLGCRIATRSRKTRRSTLHPSVCVCVCVCAHCTCVLYV